MPPCATDDSNQSVWFAFRSTDGTPVILDTDGSAVAPPGAAGGFTDTILTLHSGNSLASLRTIACDDDDPTNTVPGDFTSRIVSPTLASRTTYHVRVSSYGRQGLSTRYNGEVRLTVTGNVSSPTASEEGADAFGSRLGVGPNPMAASGRVSLTVGASQDVRVALFDALGREVRVLLSQPVAAGQRLDVPVTTAGLRSGLYVVRATGATVDLTRRVTVVR